VLTFQQNHKRVWLLKEQFLLDLLFVQKAQLLQVDKLKLPDYLERYIPEEWIGRKTPLMFFNELAQKLGNEIQREFVPFHLDEVSLFYINISCNRPPPLIRIY
jgi:hypothetical protein